jgi:hypothetical protein
VGGGKAGNGVVVEVDVLEKFYQATKDALEEAKNEVGDVFQRREFTNMHSPKAAECEDEPEACEIMA